MTCSVINHEDIGSITAAGLFSRVAASLSEIEAIRWNHIVKQYPLGAPTPHDFRQTRKKGVALHTNTHVHP